MGKQKIDTKFLDKVWISLATLFGLGFVPLLGGTIGSICGLIVFLSAGEKAWFEPAVFVLIFVSFLVSDRAEHIFREKDSKKIIIDDFTGMLISFMFIPKTPLFAICGFFLFRAFDFFKVWPANKIEDMHGGLGVAGDDVMAGIYANLVLQGLKLALNSG